MPPDEEGSGGGEEVHDEQALLDQLMLNDAEEMHFVLNRETFEPGKSFSKEALDLFHRNIALFITTRLMRRWDTTNEPPTTLTVDVKVSVG